MADSELTRDFPPLLRMIAKPLTSMFGQSSAMGALPTLRAATDPGVLGGHNCGPGGLGELRGYPKVVASSQQSYDADLQRRLWAVSEELTGVVYPLG